jgi:RNA polymerase sigma factor (TIGR02999 family)
MVLPQKVGTWYKPQSSQTMTLEPETQSRQGAQQFGGCSESPNLIDHQAARAGDPAKLMPRGKAVQVSALLGAWAKGDLAARDQIFDRLYAELKACAARCLRREHGNNSLQATALVNEVYCRLSEADPISANDRVHFMALAGRAMRHVLVDHARARLADKRGKGWQRITVNCEDLAYETTPDVLDIDRALTKLAEVDPERARLVELRYFGGYSIEETALALGCSPATVKRSWDLARSFLHLILASKETSSTTALEPQ